MTHAIIFSDGNQKRVDILSGSAPKQAFEIANQWLNEGINFSEAIAAASGLLTHCRWAAVSRLKKNSSIVDILALYDNGILTDCFSYDFQNTPCEQVLGKEKFCRFSNVQRAFPKDPDLKTMGIADYAGYAFKNAAGEVAGHLFVMHDRTIENIEVVEAVLTRMVHLIKLEWPDDI